MFMLLFVLTMTAYGQKQLTLITAKQFIHFYQIDSATISVSSNYKTIVYENVDSLQIKEAENGKHELIVNVPQVNKEYTVVFLTYVYELNQNIPHSKTKQNFGRRLVKIYNTVNIKYENGIITIK